MARITKHRVATMALGLYIITTTLVTNDKTPGPKHLVNGKMGGEVTDRYDLAVVDSFRATTVVRAAPPTVTSHRAIMAPERERMIRRALPQVTDDGLHSILSGTDVIFYSDEEIPGAYQDFDGVESIQGIHDPANNISNDRSEPFGNGNREFPWGHPFGTHTSKGSRSWRFIRLPLDNNGNYLPVVWWRNAPVYDNRVSSAVGQRPGRTYSWVFPAGTIVGEVLYMTDSRGDQVVYEIRTRRRHLNRWTMNVYRPFPTAASLLVAVTALPNYSEDRRLSNLAEHLSRPMPTHRYSISDDNHPDRVVIKSIRKMDILPDIGEDNAISLLRSQPFKQIVGIDWRDEPLSPTAPTTAAKLHIIPKNYLGGFIDVNSKSCMTCHDTCGIHVREFDFKRDWYGNVRGSDGIFSFHIFDRSCISRNGSGLPVVVSAQLSKMGIIEKYDPDRHDDRAYMRVKGLR